MEKLIQFYRHIIDGEWCPSLIKKLTSRVALRIARILYTNRQIRAWDYEIAAFGRSFYIAADWMDYADAQALIQPTYESETAKFIYKNLRNGELFVNLGSSIGYFPMLVSSWKRENRIISVEAFSRNVAFQERSMKKNGFDITLIHKVVGSKAREGEIRVKYLNSGSGSTIEYFGNQGVNETMTLITEKCQSTTLPELVKECKIMKIDMLLMDIQNAEYETLYHAEALIKNGQIGQMIIEYVNTPENRKLYDFLIKLGYKAHKILPSGDLQEVGLDDFKSKRNYVYKRD